ncbi:hypothetical protein HMI46_26850 [Paenibacillus alvei]|uniref:Uncharacterized protein n=2 Tax=Paenibacillus alvei TaxID=44250 RepID=A0AAP7A797_PAEAL|nr:hypothetical protein [Paenibacillus alvei]
MSQSAEQYQIEEPAVEEPAVEEPVVEEPAVEEPVVEEPFVKEHYEPQGFVPALPWIGMGVADLLGWLFAGAATVAIVYEAGEAWVTVNDMIKELTSSKKNDKPKFFVAFTKNGNKTPLLIGKPLTEGEAEDYMKANIRNNVWAVSQKDAMGLAMRIGRGKPAGEEKHDQTGFRGTLYYWHYHDKDRNYGHIFYGGQGFEGKN